MRSRFGSAITCLLIMKESVYAKYSILYKRFICKEKNKNFMILA